ncbi:uncharacterized protein MYCFIDRAFT_208679 [Pseudocercospora fijiensis CIRAD86]|uniref:Uncharacterized protein n=1 Tax=Pseudocercospora fijiensis (strain CIRAD86) TaxID=383855 RepID=M3A390_PSEFD|nr:uncharacterized protein MYCFIDRAFT_208679 [Pseudocercospora fijiensis CIRAD86]EME79111.1 hypothetical protein MYCFIDRAFT_208679 [Pseudocercospora fijiensis CIRAD86]
MQHSRAHPHPFPPFLFSNKRHKYIMAACPKIRLVMYAQARTRELGSQDSFIFERNNGYRKRWWRWWFPAVELIRVWANKNSSAEQQSKKNASPKTTRWVRLQVSPNLRRGREQIRS